MVAVASELSVRAGTPLARRVIPVAASQGKDSAMNIKAMLPIVWVIMRKS